MKMLSNDTRYTLIVRNAQLWVSYRNSWGRWVWIAIKRGIFNGLTWSKSCSHYQSLGLPISQLKSTSRKIISFCSHNAIFVKIARTTSEGVTSSPIKSKCVSSSLLFALDTCPINNSDGRTLYGFPRGLDSLGLFWRLLTRHRKQLLYVDQSCRFKI